LFFDVKNRSDMMVKHCSITPTQPLTPLLPPLPKNSISLKGMRRMVLILDE